ncbi:DUF2807 domain-containing protein [Fibrisoma montanum]|uniref:DUF2807 domain-containing protein n=1 Tax=Fibrisoma montanum TaxID=2305895 RepID=A0A418LXE3_9BACT|nr:head GIN domain-containing protein [Fibrisoma montanum]RIV17934.1 DUF2807 domain-containing protein [Fibrisoma montanum]
MKRNPIASRLALFAGTFLLTLASIAAVAQDETRTFSLSNFDKVSLGSAFTISVRQGSNYSVKASGRKQDIDDLEANVSGGTLVVRYRQNMRRNNRERVNIDVVMPALRGADLSGASTSTITGFRKQDALDLSVSGASTSTIDVDADRLTMDLSGASNVTLKGRADKVKGDVSGATRLRAYDLKTETATVDASGASSVQINAAKELTVEASGASSVRYKGAPSISSNTSGASSVRRDG